MYMCVYSCVCMCMCMLWMYASMCVCACVHVFSFPGMGSKASCTPGQLATSPGPRRQYLYRMGCLNLFDMISDKIVADFLWDSVSSLIKCDGRDTSAPSCKTTLKMVWIVLSLDLMIVWDMIAIFRDMISLCSPGYPWCRNPPALASQALGLKVCVTTPGN